MISFSLPEAGQISLDVLDMLGRRVVTLAEGAYDAGRHQIVWNGLTEKGVAPNSGVYFYRLKTDSFESTKRMTLIK